MFMCAAGALRGQAAQRRLDRSQRGAEIAAAALAAGPLVPPQAPPRTRDHSVGRVAAQHFTLAVEWWGGVEGVQADTVRDVAAT
jgi:hypothetical protein